MACGGKPFRHFPHLSSPRLFLFFFFHHRLYGRGNRCFYPFLGWAPGVCPSSIRMCCGMPIILVPPWFFSPALPTPLELLSLLVGGSWPYRFDSVSVEDCELFVLFTLYKRPSFASGKGYHAMRSSIIKFVLPGIQNSFILRDLVHLFELECPRRPLGPPA